MAKDLPTIIVKHISHVFVFIKTGMHPVTSWVEMCEYCIIILWYRLSSRNSCGVFVSWKVVRLTTETCNWANSREIIFWGKCISDSLDLLLAWNLNVSMRMSTYPLADSKMITKEIWRKSYSPLRSMAREYAQESGICDGFPIETPWARPGDLCSLFPRQTPKCIYHKVDMFPAHWIPVRFGGMNQHAALSILEKNKNDDDNRV